MSKIAKFILMVFISFTGLMLALCTNSNEKPGKEHANKETTENREVSKTGIGPVKEVELSSVDHELARKGENIFETKCTACHKLEKRYVGPALQGITKRREPEWIMNMILNPVEMVDKDPTAQKLLGEYITRMTFQNVSREDARAILEFFRRKDQKS